MRTLSDLSLTLTFDLRYDARFDSLPKLAGSLKPAQSPELVPLATETNISERFLGTVRMLRLLALFVGVCTLSVLAACAPPSRDNGDEKVLYIPLRTAGPNSLDPVKGSSQYDSKASSYVYQTLLQYHYLKRPLELEPLLLAEMPEVSADGKLYRFKLRTDVYFHDDECFPDGKGRQLVAQDVFYSWKRMADNKNQPKGWWLLKDSIIGFDEYKAQQNEAEKFDYDAPVEGFKLINDHEFEVHLKQPFYRFTYTLAMFQTAIVPREAVEYHKKKFSRHPVGTGPFLLKNWEANSRMTFIRNANYREEYYPDDPGLNEDSSEPYEGYLEDKQLGFYEDAGKRLPLTDRVELGMFADFQPMWLKFRNHELDYVMVPFENYTEAYIKRNRKLRKDFIEEGIRSDPVPLLDLIYHGFNMEDPDFGGYDDKHK